MSLLVTTPAAVVSAVLLLTCGLAAAEPAAKNPTAMEKMMPHDQVPKMQACEKRAMDEKIEMAERTRFVKKCMAK